jgi:hypothetical protein
MSSTPKMKVRAGQREFERGVELHRVCGLLARRQYGKTTIASRIALKKMMRRAGHTVIFGSVKLDLGREIVRKEAETIQRTLQSLAAEAAAKASTLLDVVDAAKGTSVAGLQLDDFADLYEHSRLEFRLFHSRSVYSRTKVIALTPDAVGETGDLIMDEVGRAKKFREVLEAVMPIIASNPEFRAIYTTTPPPQDDHPSFDLLAPPTGMDLPVNPKGNWYKSELGVMVLRITAEDAFADGVPLYDDDTGKPISPAESRARSHDKDAWDRNYGCLFVLGGTAAMGLLVLDTAQRRGVGQCEHFHLESDLDLERAARWIADKLGPGQVGLGWDLATTEKGTSNPSAFTVLERQGNEYLARAIVTWKTNDPAIAGERAARLVRAVGERKAGGKARRLCIDATNERYFSTQMQRELRGELPVELVVGSESHERPGTEPMTMKQYLGALLVDEADDNHLTLPPSRYIREDFRLVKRDRGSFVCEPDAQGRHGDTFDSTKLALHALGSGKGLVATAIPAALGYTGTPAENETEFDRAVRSAELIPRPAPTRH